MVTLIATSDVVAAIAIIALVAITLAVCVYLYGLKGKGEASTEDSEPTE